MMLPPHEWDSDSYRNEIHTAFDIWFIHYQNGNHTMARRWQRTLRQLTNRAKLRHEAIVRARARGVAVTTITDGATEEALTATV